MTYNDFSKINSPKKICALIGLKSCFYLTIRLRARDFYHAYKSRANDPIRSTSRSKLYLNPSSSGILKTQESTVILITTANKQTFASSYL